MDMKEMFFYTAITKMDYKNKIMAGDFNKAKNKVAVASQNCFFIYSMWISILYVVNDQLNIYYS